MRKRYFLSFVVLVCIIILSIAGIVFLPLSKKTTNTSLPPIPSSQIPQGPNELPSIMDGTYFRSLDQSTLLLKATILSLKASPKGGILATIQFPAQETGKKMTQTILLAPLFILTKLNAPNLFTTSNHIKQTFLKLKTLDISIKKYINTSVILSFQLGDKAAKPAAQTNSLGQNQHEETLSCNKGFFSSVLSGNPVNCTPTAKEITVYENF